MPTSLAELIGGTNPGEDTRLRQAIVVGTPAGGLCTIRFGGTDAADNISGVGMLASAQVANGDTVWVLQTGGALLILGRLDTNSGAWLPWTPQLNNGALGNGTLTARYMRVGRVVHVSFLWVLGSTSDITSWFSVSNFPVAVQAAGGVGPVFMGDSSTSNRAVGVIVLSGTSANIFATIGGNGHVNNTYPWDWAAGDVIQFSMTYEAAS